MIPSSQPSPSFPSLSPQEMNVVFQTCIKILKDQPKDFGSQLQTVLDAILKRVLSLPSKELALNPSRVTSWAKLFGIPLNTNALQQKLTLAPGQLSKQCLEHLEAVYDLFKPNLQAQEPGHLLNQAIISWQPEEGGDPHLNPSHIAGNFFLGMTCLKTAIETGLYDRAPEDGDYEKKEFEYITRSSVLAEANIHSFNHCSPSLTLTKENRCRDSQHTKLDHEALLRALPKLVEEEETYGQIKWTIEKIQAYAQARLTLAQQSAPSSAAAAASP